MKIFKCLTVFAALVLAQGAFAYSTNASDKENQQIESKSLQAAQSYAERLGKPVPEPVNYTYGMKLDVAKLVYMSPVQKHCGNVNRLMTYEDSQGSLKTVRYISTGECRNQK